MIRKVWLKNFKAWRDLEEIDLAPVTLLLGTNSAGKSSLIQSLLLLKQTVASPDRTLQLNLGGSDTGDLFDFGDWGDLVHGNALDFELGIQVEADGHSSLITLSLEYGRDSSRAPVIEQWRLVDGDSSFRAIRREKGAYSLYVGDEVQPRSKSRNYAPERAVALPADAISVLGADGKKAEDLSLLLRRQLESIAYLGPLRRRALRGYDWNRSRPGELDQDGGNAIQALFSAANATKRQREELGVDVLKEVSRWIKRMDLADGLSVKGSAGRYSIVLQRGDSESNLVDVGTGISQVLPVLVLAFHVPAGSTILVEEPEIHLHPLAQRELAELFLHIARERNVQCIVETHSEHLFRRLQTLVAQDSLSREEVALYFVAHEGGHAKLIDLEMDDVGRITNWPDKFFGDAAGELKAQAKAAIERAKEARSG